MGKYIVYSVAVLFLFSPMFALAQNLTLYVYDSTNGTQTLSYDVVPWGVDQSSIPILYMAYHDDVYVSWSTVNTSGCKLYVWWGHTTSARDGDGTNTLDGDQQWSWTYMTWVAQTGIYTLACSGTSEQTSVIMSVAPPPVPTCSVWADTNPIGYGNSTTLRWSSTGSWNSFYISGIGYVTPNTTGSATVGPLSSTAYNGTASGAGGTVSCPFTLTVNSPASCTFNGSTVAHGSSVTAYQAATVPASESCVSQTRTCSNGTLSGTYTHASCAVAPTCSISVSPPSVVQGNSSTVTWSSTNATSCTGTNFSTGDAAQNTSPGVSVSPSESTTYTATCEGPGGVAACTGTGDGGTGAALTVTCAPSTVWTCADSQTIASTTIAANCASTVTNTTCTLPNFCSAGASSCLYNAITGSISASPRLVASGKPTQVTWSTSNATSCSVTGNDDSWTGTSGSATSSPITQVTRYTINCDDADADATQDDFSDSVVVIRVPGWLEI